LVAIFEDKSLNSSLVAIFVDKMAIESTIESNLILIFENSFSMQRIICLSNSPSSLFKK